MKSTKSKTTKRFRAARKCLQQIYRYCQRTLGKSEGAAHSSKISSGMMEPHLDARHANNLPIEDQQARPMEAGDHELESIKEGQSEVDVTRSADDLAVPPSSSSHGEPSRPRRRIWKRALSPVRCVEQVARTASDAPLKVAHGVVHFARAASDGVSAVAKKSVSIAKNAAAEITPLRKKSRARREKEDDDPGPEDDGRNEEVEFEDDEEIASTATTEDYSVMASVRSSLNFIGATSRQLQLLSLFTMALAILATGFYWNRVAHNQWPTSLVIGWFVVAFCSGRAVEAWIVERKLLQPVTPEVEGHQRPQLRRRVPSKAKQSAARPKKGIPHTILANGNNDVKQVNCNEDIRPNLMNRLVRNPVYRHKKVLYEDNGGSILSTSSRVTTKDIGSKEPLIGQIVDPICKLRGMDVFLMETAEEDLASHPFLINHGLRNIPTFMVNLVAQWGNLALYYELPTWFESWDALDEDDNDPVDVKALKRFLLKDDDYRTSRIRMLPSVVEGPLPIRVLVPPKKDISVEGNLVPCSWKKYELEVTSDGIRLAPVLELEVDLVSSRTMRGMASLVKRYLPSISVDVAIVLQKPDGQVEDEPEACLCFWKFHHLEITGSPPLPDRSEVMNGNKNDQQHPDVLRASKFVQMSEEEISQLSIEAEA